MRKLIFRYCWARFSSFFPLALGLLITPAAYAGWSVNILMYHTLPGLSTANGYDVGAYLSTNTDLPAAPLGHYIVTSPGGGGASHIEYDLTASNLMTTANYSSAYTDFNTFIQQVTNGNWTIEVTNSTSTNYFNFTVSADGFTSNVFSIPVTVTYPLANAVVPTNHPNFTWQGPSNWQGGLAVEDYAPNTNFTLYQSISPSLTSWNGFSSLPEGTNVFYVSYSSNSSSLLIASTPLNTNTSVPISAWSSTSTIETYAFIPFTVQSATSSASTNLSLIAHYTFDDGLMAATDFSGNGNSLTTYNTYGGGSLGTISTAITPPDARIFLNNNGAGGAYYTSVDSSLLQTLSGSFSISLWLSTSQTSGNNTDQGINNASILADAHSSLSTNYVIPMAITGSKLGFCTVGASAQDIDTLHSIANINNGSYIHAVVTRDQKTGAKKIYLNGVLDSSDVGTTNVLSSAASLWLGTGPGTGYSGLIDEIQIYSGVLSASQVAQLYSNPGTTATASPPPSPVSVSLSLEISRSQDSLVSSGQTYFSVFPTITSISPAPITIDRIESPDAAAYCEVSAGQTSSSSSTSTDYSSLGDLQAAMSSGPWTLYINRGDASQQIFYFNVSAAALTTNVLAPVTITVPAAFATNVPSLQNFQWSGPAGYSSVFASADAYPSFVSDGFGSFTGNPTMWQPTTPLPAGSNVFTVTYTSNGYPNVTFTVPADMNQVPISNWTTQVQLTTYDEIVFSAASPLQVQITPAASTSVPGNFGFSFPTVSGHSHLIQVRTNLTSGTWMNLTNIPGDGSVENFSTPLTNSVPGQYFRVITQ